jgi:predicted aldo/keto reductase-like oxidoreductase
MSKKKADYSRRDFLKTAGAVGLGSMIAPIDNLAHAKGLYAANESQQNLVPTRPFGKTGVNVSILSLGGVLGMSDIIVFRQAMKMGITYWDTADSYGRGKNEKAIGKYFDKFPDDRKDVFLVTKAGTSNPNKLTEKLNSSLNRMNTSYIDLYFIHYVKEVKDELTNAVKEWAEKAKADGKIRFFGFSAHKNMENSLLAAAKLGWIDGIMMSYNYRLMVKDEMKRAVDACAKAGIGLTAMKTQAAFLANFYATIGSKTDDALNMTESFLKKGYTEEQAKLKVVWENPNIASICSAMPNMTILQANVEAALSKTKLSSYDHRLLKRHSRETTSYYCAGCSNNCEPTLNNEIPISDVMRYLMYCRGYSEPERARAAFRRIPPETREVMACLDYKEAEQKCPQGMRIGRLMREAVIELS